MKKREIIPLPKEQWKNVVIPMRYTTNEYYDVVIENLENGCRIEMQKKQLAEPISHYPEAYAWGVLDENGELSACIETCPEEWSNRLMVTELWVHEKLRRQGIGHALMGLAKQQANLEHRRAIILETQSCNVPAITFYQKEGFQVIGFDSCCYSNNDRERKEVRMDLGYFPRKPKVKKEEVLIRQEKEEEYHAVEEVALRAFWNKHHMGCDEHFLVHKMRKTKEYLPELSRIAVVNGEIAAVICYAKAKLVKGEEEKEILTFGPLCVAPEWQGCGVGGILLTETLKLAKEHGYEGIVIFGEPDYYPLHGFQRCEAFGITTIKGENSSSFLGYELKEGALKAFGGSFLEPSVFEDLPAAENEEYTKLFSAPEKQRFPKQWKD